MSSSEQDEREVLDSVESLTRLQEQADTLRAENERLKAGTGTMGPLEYIAFLRAENERLRALIDKHNDECRECPVIEA